MKLLKVCIILTDTEFLAILSKSLAFSGILFFFFFLLRGDGKVHLRVNWYKIVFAKKRGLTIFVL